MVKKKGKSKRVTLKDKYKIQKRVVETHRKQRKQTKRDAKAGIFRHDKKKKDPGIPNSWPFKQDLLKEIQRTRERAKQQQAEAKERKRSQLASLREHQQAGGTATTIQELMDRAQNEGQAFENKVVPEDPIETSATGGGQSSRRAYLRELKKVVDSADVLLQVLDARDPISSRIHASVENAVLSHADKRMVLVLNKIDLVPKTVVGQWLTVLRKSHPTIAIKASNDKAAACGTVNEDSAIPVGMEGLLQLLKNYARTGAAGNNKKNNKSTIVVGIIGYPNVGKSSIINALKRCRAVGVSPTPGFTTCMQEVVLDRNVRLLDSPGVVFDDSSAMMGNCVNADTMEDPITPVAAIVKRCNQSSLVMTYNIPAFPPNDVMMFLAMVARSLGRVRKGGIPDKMAAARTVLRDWNSGKIPYYTPPPLQQSAGAAVDKHQDAVIVSQFGQEFDVSKFDDEIMNTLQETDEMDFVQLTQNKQQQGGEQSYKEAVAVLTGEEVDDEEMDDSDGSAMDYQHKPDDLADAEDYDFDDM